MQSRYFIEVEGVLIPLGEGLEPFGQWAEWCETAERQVKDTRLPSGAWVSTLFLGLNQNGEEEPPLLYESRMFGGPLDRRQVRYATREEARVGHDRLVGEIEEAEAETARLRVLRRR